MSTKKVWFVTGASKGLGKSLVLKLLQAGYQVAATSRSRDALVKAIGEKPGFLPLEVDLLDEQSVLDAVSKTVTKFGSIDVVVNNAGFGQVGTLEELSDEEARKNFDVNVFGLLNVIRKVMPQLRKQKSGHIYNVSSIGGFNAEFPGWGIYCATKFAVTALTESLSAEAKEFGVTATVVYPGYFRTDFLSSDSLILPRSSIPDYTSARALEAKHVEGIHGNQQGDPDKASDVLIQLAESKAIPLHLFLGQDAYDLAKAKIGIVQKDMNDVESLATSTAIQG